MFKHAGLSMTRNHGLDEKLAGVDAALAAGRAHLAFQPVVSATRPHLVLFQEGLIRLRDTEGRPIPAGEFIAAAEPRALGRRIDCAALTLAAAALREDPGLVMSVNLSARSVASPEWRRCLQDILNADLGNRLILEITEASAMTMPDLIAAFSRDMQRAGVRLAMDDFGAGQTSFSTLRDVHFDILKIDGSFVRDAVGNADSQAFIRAFRDIAQHFGMQTVAEFVETSALGQMLCGLGIDGLQGFLFGPPRALRASA